MRRKFTPPPSQLPGLFDDIDGPEGRADAPFELIPPERMERIASLHARSSIDEMSPLEPSDKIFFMSFGSGSSGNCAYIGDRNGGFLIDAGIDARKVTKTLQDNGITMDRVAGILLTHDHHDHISQAYALLRVNRHMRLYCTPRTFNGILRRHNVSRRIRDYHTPIYKEFPLTIGRFTVTPFEVMHDGSDNAGFNITHGDRSITIATDLGSITDRVDYYMRQADTIVIEANYDLTMLTNGRYPEHLKARIKANNGHLDNEVTAKYLSMIFSEKIRHIYLCHLSLDNNTPVKAVTTVEDALMRVNSSIGSMPEIIALPRYDSTPLYTL